MALKEEFGEIHSYVTGIFAAHLPLYEMMKIIFAMRR